MTRLLITGGMGFLGLQAARHFLKRGVSWCPLSRTLKPLTRLTLFDLDFPATPLPTDITSDDRVQVQTGDITDAEVPVELVTDRDHAVGNLSVIHLASMVSGDSEVNPELAWQVNVEAQRRFLNALQEHAPGARFIFASSTATFGPATEGNGAPSDTSKQVPQNTYGFHKVVCEQMLNEYHRRGAVDGRGLRLPVIVVRPGAPNAAMSGAWSSAVREPLAGMPCTLAVPADSVMPVASYQLVVRAMEHLLLDLDSDALGADRTLTLPALSTSPAALHDAAARLFERSAGAREKSFSFGELIEQPNEAATRVMAGMGSHVDGSRALLLGVPADPSIDSIVEDYARDYTDLVV